MAHEIMARAPAVLAATVAFAAAVAPAGADELGAEAAVGIWRGKATWKGCTVAGAARVVFDVSRIDGRYRIGLERVRDGLGAVDLDPDTAGALAGVRDDLEVRLEAKRGAVTLRLKTGAGCVATAKVGRDSTGIPACDDYRALTLIKASCSAMGDGRSGDADATGRQLAGWTKARGARRKDAAAGCAKAAEPLRVVLTAQLCLPAAGSGPTGLVECDRYFAILGRYLRCDRIPPGSKDATRRSSEAMRAALARLNDPDVPAEARSAADDACRSATESLTTSLAAVGCDRQ